MNIEKKVSAKAHYHHGNLRDQLVKAAEELVAREGVHAFKVAEACRLAGVSTAAPYRHFRDREDILDAVSQRGFVRLRDDLLSRSRAHRSGTTEAISGCGMAYVAFAVREPQIFRLMFGRCSVNERMPSPGDGADPNETGASAYDVLLHHVSLYLHREPESRAVLETSLMLWTGVHGLSSLVIDDNLEVSKLAVDIDHMVMRMTERLLP